jgi:hypothetical protein
LPALSGRRVHGAASRRYGVRVVANAVDRGEDEP